VDPASTGGQEAEVTGETVVNYYFPVEIEVVGTVGDEVVDQVAQQVFDQLDRELSSRL
jgi:hypothetical protein